MTYKPWNVRKPPKGKRNARRTTRARSSYAASKPSRTRKKNSKKIPSLPYLRSITLGAIFLLLSYLIFTNASEIVNFTRNINIQNPIGGSNILDNARDNRNQSVIRTAIILTEEDSGGVIEVATVFVLIENPEKGLNWLIHIPPEVYIPSSFSDFTEQVTVSNLHYLGEVVGEGLGLRYTVWELGQLLGYTFNNYIWIQPDGTDAIFPDGEISQLGAADKFGRLKGSFDLINLLLNRGRLETLSLNTYSNLNRGELTAFHSRLGAVDYRSEDVLLDLSKGDFIEPLSIGIGEVPYLSYTKLDPKLSEIGVQMLDKEIEKEQGKVEIFNGSEIGGMAYRYSRKLSNIGMRVIRIDNAGSPYEKSTIYISRPEDYANSLEGILKQLPITPEIIYGRPQFLTTGDIILVLGNDLHIDSSWLVDEGGML